MCHCSSFKHTNKMYVCRKICNIGENNMGDSEILLLVNIMAQFPFRVGRELGVGEGIKLPVCCKN